MQVGKRQERQKYLDKRGRQSVSCLEEESKGKEVRVVCGREASERQK